MFHCRMCHGKKGGVPLMGGAWRPCPTCKGSGKSVNMMPKIELILKVILGIGLFHWLAHLWFFIIRQIEGVLL